ncbi:hypothetical protein CBR_g3948 [Chara braunii]|uniref:Uncharacterized protein n=1 Tax=Chara braunii TaxID=69332 RepID=A0A388KGQ9_CHABU|nr:hypothetical protein CBR_g3948 [Chara braunii]|eukprot:GBG69250.1 hypothetical protein CBR_g3948 [Chara braunii]
MVPSSSLALSTCSASASRMGKPEALVSSDLSEGAEARCNDHTAGRVRGGAMSRQPSLPSIIRCRADRARCGSMWRLGEVRTHCPLPGCCCHGSQRPLHVKGLPVTNPAVLLHCTTSNTACSSLSPPSSASHCKISRRRRGQLSPRRSSKARLAWLSSPPQASLAHKKLPASADHSPMEDSLIGRSTQSHCATSDGTSVYVSRSSGCKPQMQWRRQLLTGRKEFVQNSLRPNCSSSCSRGMCGRPSFPAAKHGKTATITSTNALPSSVESNASADSAESVESVVALDDDNHIQCDICSGSGWFVCDFCQGQKTNVQVNNSTRMYRRCPSCKAAGVLMCPKCKSLKCVTFPGLEDEPSTFSEWI